MRAFIPRCFLAVLVLSAWGCSSERAAKHAADDVESPLTRVGRITRSDEKLHARVSISGALGFVRDDDRVTSAGYRSARREARIDVGVKLAETFDGATTIGVGRTSGLTTTWRAEGARPARLELESGRAVYRDAFAGTDAVWVSDESFAELLYVLRDASAPSTFAWRVELPAGTSMRREEGGALAFVDTRGEARLRIPKAFAIDANGARRDATMEWSDGRLALTLDTRGLTYPIALDPVVETVAWTRYASWANHTGAAMATLGGKVVMFGGFLESGVAVSDTWEFDGASWTLKNPTTSPPARAYHTMATLGSKAVLFGGCSFPIPGDLCSTMYDDTWEWDGADWSPKTPALKPPPRREAGAATLGTTKVVLFGGLAGSPLTRSNQTWDWNGTNWANRTAATVTTTNTPTARNGLRMAALGATKVVLFGGATASSAYSNQTWEWDGTAWTNKTHATPTATNTPTARSNFALAAASSTKIVLAGGATSINERTDTWEYDGAAWIEKTVTTPLPIFVNFLSGASFGSKVIVAGRMADTRQWDGTDWSVAAIPAGPRPRNNGKMASFGDKVVLFGGSSGGGLADTWEWAGSSWTLKTPATSPPARSTHTMGSYLGAAGRRVVVYGGSGNSGTGVGADTWEYDGTTWEKKTVATPPPSIRDAAMAPIGTPERLVMFGGSLSNNAIADTWEWDGASWARKLPGKSPPARLLHAAASLSGKALIFGGSASGQAFDDTWSYDGSTWNDLTSTTRPPPRYATMTTLGSKIVLSPEVAATNLPSPWVWSGTEWSSRSPSPRPSMTTFSGQLFATAGNVAVLHEQATGETWTLRITVNQGSPCGADADCDTGFCRDGVCCATACAGACDACSATLKSTGIDGECGPTKPDTDPRNACKDSGTPACQLDGMCNGTGACRSYAQATGCAPRACTQGSECASGFCADGICCDKACTGACEACTAAKKGTGVDGICEPVAAGSDPKDQCTQDPGYPNSCKQDGACDGAGSCRLAAAGLACGTTTCDVAKNEVSGSTCDGVGICSTTPKSCVPYKCKSDGSACAATCATSADCATGSFCAAGVCITRKANGQTATNAAECASGFLADSVCCVSACTGVCEACDVAGSKGACAPVVGVAKHGTCPAASGSDPCAARVCDGQNGETCGGFVGQEIACRVASCAEGVETQGAKCEGKGSCPAPLTRKCEPLACDATTCKAKCAADVDCVGGTKCETSSGKCVSSASCIDDHTLQPLTGSTVDCSPYRCSGAECRTTCASSSDCVGAFVCDAAAQKCVSQTVPPTPEVAEDSGGCSVSATRSRGASTEARGLGIALFLAMALVRARRRARGAAVTAAALAPIMVAGCSSQRPEPATEPLARVSSALETITWTKKTFAPALRFKGLLASHGTKLVFFGSSGATATDETWEWDGAAWKQKLPVTVPPGNVPFAIATRKTSAGGERVVLAGGLRTSNEFQTWEWDGSNWSKKSPAASPLPRDGHAMGPIGTRVVLFGGNACTVTSTTCTAKWSVDTWEWDGTTWSSKTPATITATNNPPLRSEFAMAGLGAPATKTVLTGGRDCTGTGTCSGNIPTVTDTWEWSGTAWSKATATTALPGRYAHGAATLAGKVVVFGGTRFSTLLHNDTWEYDGVNWSPKTTGAVPSSHTGLTMATLTPSTGSPRVVVVGSRTRDSGHPSEQWEYDGSNWLPRQIAAAPSARAFAAMATIGSGASARAILFGGYRGTCSEPSSCAQTTEMLDTWQWDGATWTLRAPAAAPRKVGAMATVGVGGSKLVLFAEGETWEWDGTTWTQKTPTTSPTLRQSHAMSSLGTKAVLHAGEGVQDTWEWDGIDWTQKLPAASPPVRHMHSLVSRNDGTILMFGGYSAFNKVNETWLWDGSAWTDRTPRPIPTTAYPAGRFFPPLATLGSKTVMPDTTSTVLWVHQAGGWSSKTVTAGPVSGVMTTVGDDAVLFGAGATGDETWTLHYTADVGSTCGHDKDCDTGFCRDGVCCATSCDGACQACAASLKQSVSGDGTCGPAKAGIDPHDSCKDSGSPTCLNDGTCDGAGACRKYASATSCAPSPCTKGDQCVSGFCSDGVCCDRACGGACEACTAALKGSGGDGTCGAVPAGATSPATHATCTKSAQACKADGLCDGTGKCRENSLAGAPCGATTCMSGQVTGTTCDGIGTCGSTPQSCSPYACATDGTKCATSCVSDGDCAAIAFCTVTGLCVAKKPNGDPALEARECRSGIVADKVCCDRKCSGICEACDSSSSKGACAPVVGAPRHGSCIAAPSGGDPCAAEVCNGMVGETCAGKVSLEVECRVAECRDGVARNAERCVGTGACPPAQTTPCAPYACGATTCLAACTADLECATGYRCDVASAKCVSGASCKDDHTVVSPTGEPAECAPLRCVDGACLKRCESSADCVAGFACDGAACVPATPTTGDDGGCAITPRGRARTGAAPFAFLALLVVAASRRVRRVDER